MKRVLLLFVLFVTAAIGAFAQTHTVTGKILDENGQGYPGAGITVKGTQIGTVSDVNGDFMLEVPDGDDEFIVQAVGYTTRDVKESNGSLVIKLHAISKELEGTVVTALAIKREKRELGYTSTTVDNEELTAANNTSPLSSLAGKVAGADITSSTGGPGGATRIILRGEKSIRKDNNALIVIDGVIVNNYDRTSDPSGLAQVDFGNAANDIDPDEIASITVLEGPAAAALYGAAGANGAVMITTKSGKHSEGNKKSKMEITYKTTYTQSDVLKYPLLQQQYGQGSIYTGIVDDRQDNFSWGYKFDGSLKPWGQIIDGKQLVKPWVDQPNALKQYFNHGKDLNNFVSLAGGTEKSTYYLSLTALNSDGVTPNTFYNKYSVRFNSTTQLSNNFYSSINLNYINSYSRVENTGQSSGGIMQALLQIPTDIPIGELKSLSNPFYSMDFVDGAGVNRYGYFGAYSKNPFWVSTYYKNLNKTDRVLGDFNIGYKKGDFNVFNRTGLDATNDRSYYETPNLNVQSTDQTGLYGGNVYYNPGGYQQNNYTGMRFYNDLIGNFTHALSNNFGINALVGDNVTIQHDETLNANINPGTNGLVIPNFYNFTNNAGPIYVINPINNARRFSVYADIKFNFRKELYLELTGRNEWSSTLVTGNNSYFYPGANASWVFTERLHGNFKDKFLNYGKVRIGTAGVSSDAVPYANNSAGFTQAPISTAFGSIVPPFNSQPAYQVQNTFGQQSLKPELTREYETGFDLAFLKNRLNLSFTYYNDITHNLITAVPLPPSSGFAFNYTNVGDISNKGEELSISGTPISTRWGLKWDLFGTYTHNVSDVASLVGNVSQVALSGFQTAGGTMDVVAAVGHPYGTYYATNIQTWTDPTTHIVHDVVDPNTGLPVATKTPQLLGSFLPKFQASWGTSLTYKGLKLYALFSTKQGGKYYSGTKSLMDFVGSSQGTVVNNRNPYVWANSVYNVPNTNIYLPNTTKFLPYNYWAVDEYYNLPAQDLVDASYVKLQELSLSYKIPQKYYTRSPFGSLEAGVFGNNLIVWTPKSNQYDDPEETSMGATGNGQGLNNNARPSLRNYGVFLKVTF